MVGGLKQANGTCKILVDNTHASIDYIGVGVVLVVGPRMTVRAAGSQAADEYVG
jgi:hypothetical protein